MRRAVLLLACALAGAGEPPQSNYFLGSWSCAGTTWTFAPLLDGAGWLRVVYGDPAHPGGTAVVGYVKSLDAWVYRDFHADGSYADLTSAGAQDGKWVWTGPYYPAAGGTPLQGRITYTIVGPGRYDRTFESLEDGNLVKHGGDSCTKQAP